MHLEVTSWIQHHQLKAELVIEVVATLKLILRQAGASKGKGKGKERAASPDIDGFNADDEEEVEDWDALQLQLACTSNLSILQLTVATLCRLMTMLLHPPLAEDSNSHNLQSPLQVLVTVIWKTRQQFLSQLQQMLQVESPTSDHNGRHHKEYQHGLVLLKAAQVTLPLIHLLDKVLQLLD